MKLSMIYLKEATEAEKRDQLARAKKYIQDNPEDPDNDELYELIDKLEKELGSTNSSLGLDAMLKKAKDIVASVLPEMSMDEIDAHPTINFGNTGSRSLGICNYETNPPSITISEALKNADEEIIMNTVIHEFIHSLKICWKSGHTGNFKVLAQRVSAQTPYKVNTYATDSETKAHTDNLPAKNYYKITCKKCGTETIYYRKSRIVDNSENFICRKCGTKGAFKIDYVPKEGGVKTIKEDYNSPYQPGEREAMQALDTFDKSILPNALEELYPGCAEDIWVQGAISFESEVPVIVTKDIAIDMKEAISKIIPCLAETYQVNKAKVAYEDIEYYKLKKHTETRSDNYQPYKTVQRLVFSVDWHDTTEPHLVTYRDYIRSSMKRQNIQWESELLEGINKPVQDRIANYAMDVFLSRRYGNVKFTDYLADIEVGPDYIDIAFDFTPSEETVMNGLSGKPSKVVHPTPTEIEVTEKQIDNFMENQFPELFFRYYKVTPFFRIERLGHKWLDNNALACLYTIVQFNEKK